MAKSLRHNLVVELQKRKRRKLKITKWWKWKRGWRRKRSRKKSTRKIINGIDYRFGLVYAFNSMASRQTYLASLLKSGTQKYTHEYVSNLWLNVGYFMLYRWKALKTLTPEFCFSPGVSWRPLFYCCCPVDCIACFCVLRIPMTFFWQKHQTSPDQAREAKSQKQMKWHANRTDCNSVVHLIRIYFIRIQPFIYIFIFFLVLQNSTKTWIAIEFDNRPQKNTIIYGTGENRSRNWSNSK